MPTEKTPSTRDEGERIALRALVAPLALLAGLLHDIANRRYYNLRLRPQQMLDDDVLAQHTRAALERLNA
ncbi:MAG: hypothetical protein Kow0096_11760 [Thiohalomonadaceae bacterium]